MRNRKILNELGLKQKNFKWLLKLKVAKKCFNVWNPLRKSTQKCCSISSFSTQPTLQALDKKMNSPKKLSLQTHNTFPSPQLPSTRQSPNRILPSKKLPKMSTVRLFPSIPSSKTTVKHLVFFAAAETPNCQAVWRRMMDDAPPRALGPKSGQSPSPSFPSKIFGLSFSCAFLPVYECQLFRASWKSHRAATGRLMGAVNFGVRQWSKGAPRALRAIFRLGKLDTEGKRVRRFLSRQKE